MKFSNFPQRAFLLSMLLLCVSTLMQAQQTASSTSGIHPEQYDVAVMEDEFKLGLYPSYKFEPVAKVQVTAKPVQNKYISTEELFKLHNPSLFDELRAPTEAELVRSNTSKDRLPEKTKQAENAKLASSTTPNW